MVYGLAGVDVGTFSGRGAQPSDHCHDQATRKIHVRQIVKRIPIHAVVFTIAPSKNVKFSHYVLQQFFLQSLQLTRPTSLNCWNWSVTSDTDNGIKNLFEGQMLAYGRPLLPYEKDKSHEIWEYQFIWPLNLLGSNSEIKRLRTHVYMNLFSCFWSSSPKSVRTFQIHPVYFVNTSQTC
jgi:hypothetical protein